MRVSVDNQVISAESVAKRIKGVAITVRMIDDSGKNVNELTKTNCKPEEPVTLRVQSI